MTLIALFVRLTFIVLGAVAGFDFSFQAPPVLVVAPPAGPAGTSVRLIDVNGAMAGAQCYAQFGPRDLRIGTMAGELVYTVPVDLPASTQIIFYCAGGPSGQRSNNAVFVVVPPPAVDTDGDGLNDPEDACPTVAGPRDTNGCPAPSEPEPADSDGDGVPDSVDACPAQAGPRENNGCPAPEETSPTDSDGDGVPDSADACPFMPGLPEVNGCAPSPTPQAPPQPDVILPQLPADGPCVVATQGTTAVNIRQGTSTDTAIVGALNPAQVYPVIGQNADGSWLQIAEGWVAASVTRRGGDCAAVPVSDGALPLAEPADSGLVEGDAPTVQGALVDGAPFAGCAELLPSLNSLPNFLVLAIGGEPDPCAAAAAEMDDLFFNPAAQADTWSFPECGPQLYYGSAQSTYVSLLNRTTGATRDYLESFREDDIQFCALLVDLYLGIVTEFAFPADEHVLPVAIAYCKLGFGEGTPMTTKIGAIGVQPQHLRTLYNDCTLFSYLRELGSIPSSNVAYFNLLLDNCGVNVADAGLRAFWDAVRGALDAAAAANQGCAGFDLIYNFPLPDDLQPALPAIASGDSDCTGHFRMLATHNGNLGAETVYRVLKSIDPCDAASEYTYSGGVPNNVVPPPECIQGDQMVLGAAQFNQTIIDKSSSWFVKITAIDRPLDEMCEQTAQLGPGGAFANPPTATMGALAANPTATLPVIVANPTPTPPILVGNPTAPPAVDAFVINPTATPPLPEAAFPEPPPHEGEADDGLPGALVANPTAPTATPAQFANGQTQPQDSGGEPPAADDQEPLPPQGSDPVPQGQGAASGQDGAASGGAPCFGCQPSDPLIPGGRAGAVFIGTNADTGAVELFVLPAFGEVSPDTGQAEPIPIPLDGLPQPLPDYPVILSPDGRHIGYFGRGIDIGAVDGVMIQYGPLTGATGEGAPTEEVAFYYNRIAFNYSPTSDGKSPLEVDLTVQFPSILQPAPYAPEWTDDGRALLMSLTDASGQTSIYRLEVWEFPGDYAQRFDGLDNAQTVTPELVVANAFAPSLAPNGRYLAFERQTDTGRNVHALALNSLRENAITVPEPGTECYGPEFGADSLTVFFTCQAGGEPRMFRYGLGGLTPITTDIANARNPIPADASGFIYFDDGSTLYLSAEDGSDPIPYIQLELRNAQVMHYRLDTGN